EPGAVREAAAYRATDLHLDSVVLVRVRSSAGELPAVLQLAVRTGLGSLGQRRDRAVRGPGIDRAVHALEERPPRGMGRAVAPRRAHGRPRVLHELQVRVLAVSGQARAPARGPRARLLLPGLLLRLWRVRG